MEFAKTVGLGAVLGVAFFIGNNVHNLKSAALALGCGLLLAAVARHH